VSIILVMRAVGAGADFWQVKDTAQWTESEIQKIRTNSPWAQECKQLSTSTRSTMTKTGTTETSKSKVLVGTIVQVRWESAAPIQATTADAEMRKTVARWSNDSYVVSVGGLELPRGYSAADAVNDLQHSSSLDLGSKGLLPNRVEMVGSGENPIYLLLFPRAAKIEDLTKNIVVEIHVGKSRVRAGFGTKQMVFQGKVTL
jgi:hypothetical protein